MLDPLESLGPLEREMLELVWAFGTATARDLFDRQPAATRRAYTTIMTTLDRLYRKGLFLRGKKGRAWEYSPAMTREAFRRARVQALSASDGGGADDQNVPGNCAQTADLVALVEAADAATLDQLLGLIEARRRS